MRLRSVLLSVLAVALGLVGAAVAEAPAVVAPAEAAKQVGKEVVVEGVVVQVSVSTPSEPIYLNFGARYPKHVFAAVVFADKRALFADAGKWEGKKVRVTGTVQLYRGKPEIVLNDPTQLALAK
jgi:hypothetical protein